MRQNDSLFLIVASLAVACASDVGPEHQPFYYMPNVADQSTRSALAQSDFDRLVASVGGDRAALASIRDFGLIVIGSAPEPGDSIGQSQHGIYGGRAEPDLFPATGSLRSNELASSHFCTATALTPRVLLTAAHCVGLRATGFLFATIDGAHYKVNDVRIHPDYDRHVRPIVRDVALVFLAEDLPDMEFPTLAGAEVGRDHRIFGYGYDQDRVLGNRKSGRVEVTHVGSTLVGGRATAEDGLVIDAIDGIACHGDSGGPLVRERDGQIENRVLGVASHLLYRPFTCGMHQELVYEDLAHPDIRSWIDSNFPGPGNNAPAFGLAMPDDVWVAADLAWFVQFPIVASDPDRDELWVTVNGPKIRTKGLYPEDPDQGSLSEDPPPKIPKIRTKGLAKIPKIRTKGLAKIRTKGLYWKIRKIRTKGLYPKIPRRRSPKIRTKGLY